MKNFLIIEQNNLELTDKPLADKIECMICEGQELTERRSTESVQRLLDAWECLPEPKNGWELYSAWAASALFDAYMALSNFEDAKPWAEKTLETRSAANSTEGFISLGKVNFELNDLDEAYRWFAYAFELGSKRAFQGEKSKYLDFYLKRKSSK